jgi:hypothetical protein
VTTNTGATSNEALIGQPTNIAQSQNTNILGPVAGVLFVAVLIGPPLLARRLRRRRGES